MKKILIPAISLAAVLLTGACSIDERTSGGNGDEAMLTLNMGLDGAVQTRAIGDGLGANRLIYAVFDKTTGAPIEGMKVSKDVTFPTTETITLAKGQTYKIAFWAQNKACNAYTVSDDMVVTIKYDGAAANDENRDAFFKTVEVTVTGDAELDVELTRPFAQLNVGIYESDWTAGEAAGIVISKSKAVVKQAASTLNLLDGTVGTPVDVTFDFAAIPADSVPRTATTLPSHRASTQYPYSATGAPTSSDRSSPVTSPSTSPLTPASTATTTTRSGTVLPKNPRQTLTMRIHTLSPLPQSSHG